MAWTETGPRQGVPRGPCYCERGGQLPFPCRLDPVRSQNDDHVLVVLGHDAAESRDSQMRGLARYHSTVLANPARRSCPGTQPSASRASEESPRKTVLSPEFPGLLLGITFALDPTVSTGGDREIEERMLHGAREIDRLW